VAWYPCLYAPRAGGAHDSQHRTAGIAGRTRPRGGRVVAFGMGAAAGGTGGRVLNGEISAARPVYSIAGFPRGAAGVLL